MEQQSKQLKRLIREWAGVAHERELSRALLDLRVEFERWQAGSISAADLNDLIHQFHDGRSRNIWKAYATNRPTPAVAFALARGILRRDELPPNLVEHIAGLVEFYEQEESAS